MKLIVFTEPSKFVSLIPSDGKFINGYLITTPPSDPEFYNENNQNLIIFVKEDGTYHIDEFINEFADSASIIIIDDNYECDCFVNYFTNKDFIILRHSEEPKLLNKLSTPANPCILEQEEKTYRGRETYYFKVAKFIGNNEGKKASDIFKDLQNEEQSKKKLDNALEFLHGCLIPENDHESTVRETVEKAKKELCKINEDIESLVNDFYSKYKSKSKLEEYITDLSVFRDKLLEKILVT